MSMITVVDLVNELNQLLQALRIPITLQSPVELTPSLLLAILESLLSTRLPLSTELRKSASSPKSKDGKNAKIQCMKIFLGVLETDVLKTDVGLSKVDPRKLAVGEWNEVVFVAELLCWMGRKLRLLDTFADDNQQPNVQIFQFQPKARSPSTVTTTPTTRKSNFSPSSRATADTSNSLHNLSHLASLDPPPTSFLSPLDLSRPMCIHEVHSPDSFGAILQNERISSAQTWDAEVAFNSESPSVRYSGYIAPVNEDLEIQSFESNRSSMTESSHGSNSRASVRADGAGQLSDLSAYSNFINEDPQLKTVELLKERARLLRELAGLQAMR